MSDEPVTLAQIVAALEQTYGAKGVRIWFDSHDRWARLDDLDGLADLVARIDGFDPRDFTVTERTP